MSLRSACSTVAHLFINCSYSQILWVEFMGNVLWQVMGVPQNSVADVKIGDLISEIQLFKTQVPCWSLYWEALAIFVWHLWCVRSARYKEQQIMMPTSLRSMDLLKDLIIVYNKSWYKRTHGSGQEEIAIQR